MSLWLACQSSGLVASALRSHLFSSRRSFPSASAHLLQAGGGSNSHSRQLLALGRLGGRLLPRSLLSNNLWPFSLSLPRDSRLLLVTLSAPSALDLCISPPRTYPNPLISLANPFHLSTRPFNLPFPLSWFVLDTSDQIRSFYGKIDRERLELGKNGIGRGDREVSGRVLDLESGDDPVGGDEREPLGSGGSEEGGGVEDESERGDEGSSVVGDESGGRRSRDGGQREEGSGKWYGERSRTVTHRTLVPSSASFLDQAWRTKVSLTEMTKI